MSQMKNKIKEILSPEKKLNKLVLLRSFDIFLFLYFEFLYHLFIHLSQYVLKDLIFLIALNKFAVWIYFKDVIWNDLG